MCCGSPANEASERRADWSLWRTLVEPTATHWAFPIPARRGRRDCPATPAPRGVQRFSLAASIRHGSAVLKPANRRVQRSRSMYAPSRSWTLVGRCASIFSLPDGDSSRSLRLNFFYQHPTNQGLFPEILKSFPDFRVSGRARSLPDASPWPSRFRGASRRRLTCSPVGRSKPRDPTNTSAASRL